MSQSSHLSFVLLSVLAVTTVSNQSIIYNMWQGRFMQKFAKAAISGTAVTLGSTTVSVLLAVYVERTAHRALFTVFPHWYANVETAYGIEPWELDAVRHEPKLMMEYAPQEPSWAETTTTMPSFRFDPVSDQNVFSCAMTA